MSRLEKPDLGPDFAPVTDAEAAQGLMNQSAPQPSAIGGTIGVQPGSEDVPESGTEPHPEPIHQPEKEPEKPAAPDPEPKDEPKPESEPQSSPELELNEDGSVKFTDEMTKELVDIAKSKNPEASEDELNDIVGQQRELINQQYGKDKDSPTPTPNEEAPVSTSITEEDVNSFISSQTEGVYSDVTSLIEENKRLKEVNEFNEIHPTVKKLNEAFGNGSVMNDQDIANFFRIQTANYDQMDSVDLISEQLRMENPGISDAEISEKFSRFHVILNNNEQEINRMIEDDESVGGSPLTQNRVQALVDELGRLGGTALNNLKSRQENLATSFVPTQDEIEAQNSTAQVEHQKIIDNYNKVVKEKITTFTMDKVQTGKDPNGNPVFLEIPVDQTTKKEIEAIATNIDDFIVNRYIDKETNKTDFQKMFTDWNRLLNFDKILAVATANSAIKSRKETVERFDNISFLKGSPSSSASQNSLPSEDDQIADQMSKLYSGR